MGFRECGTASMFKTTDTVIEREVVPCASFDEVLITKNITRVGIIKIDTDGEWFFVLRCAAKTIERDWPVLLVNVCQWNLKSADSSTAEPVRRKSARR